MVEADYGKMGIEILYKGIIVALVVLLLSFIASKIGLGALGSPNTIKEFIKLFIFVAAGGAVAEAVSKNVWEGPGQKGGESPP